MRLKKQKGAAIVEFAVILPLFLVLVFGIIEFSLLFYDKAVITNASREGARAGIVAPSGDPAQRSTNAYIKGVVTNYCQNYLITFGTDTLTDSDITITPESESVRDAASFGDDLTVAVSFHYDFLLLPGFIGDLIGGTDMVATTVMKME